MKVAEKYKQTEVGLIPSDWEVMPLVEIGDIATGTTPPTNNKNNYGEDYFFVSPADLGKGKYIVDTEKKLSQLGFSIARKYPSNSILFTCIGSTIGKAGISKVELSSNQQINAVFPNDLYSTDFLFYYLNFISPKIKLGASEQAVPMINKTEFGKTLIACPTKTEQTAIASALSDADALISSLEKLIAKKRNIKQGAMQKLLQPKEGWEVKKLGEVAEMYSGGTPLTSVPSYYNGNIPWVVIADITKAGKYISETEKTISHEGVSNSSAKFFKKGVLLFAMYASIGKTTIALMDTTCNQAILGIEPKLIDKEYLYYYLSFKERHFITMGQTGTQSNLSKDMVQKLEIPIPISKEEQIRIATILSDMDAEINALETKLEKYKKVKLGMMQNLLTGKIRLNQDLQDLGINTIKQ